MRCKEKYVHSDKPIMFQYRHLASGLVNVDGIVYSYISRDRRHNCLDRPYGSHIIVLTAFYAVQPSSPSLQTRLAPPGRRSQPPPTVRSRSALPIQRVLRSRRPSAGQVRNATPRPGGQSIRQPSRVRIRPVPANVLSGSNGIRRKWLARLAPTQARPPTPPQTHRRGIDVPFSGTDRRSDVAARYDGPAHPRTVWGHCASAQHRTRFSAAGKKTLLTGAPTFPAAGEDAIAGYENLRRQALHNPSAPSGLGWTVLVRQGMAVWMKLCTESLPARPKTETPRSNADALLPCYVRSELVQILTAMALTCWQEAKV